MHKRPNPPAQPYDDEADDRHERQSFASQAIDLNQAPVVVRVRRLRRIRPSRCTIGQLDRVGVDLIDEYMPLLGCQECGHRWRPNILGGGKMPRGYWKCPENCNADVADQDKS